MAIILDNSYAYFSDGTSQTTSTISFACSGSDRLLVVTIPESRLRTYSVTYNGVSMTSAKAINDGFNSVEIFYLINPPTGTHNVVVTYNSALTYRDVCVMSFNGIKQISPLGATASVSGNVQNKSLSITTTQVNSLIIEVLSAQDGTHTATASQSVVLSGGNRMSSYKIVTTATSYDETYSSTISQDSCFAIAEFLESVLPTVTTQDATDVTKDSFTANGNITALGGVNATRRGFCYKQGTSGDPSISDPTIYEDGDFSTGAYNLPIT